MQNLKKVICGWGFLLCGVAPMVAQVNVPNGEGVFKHLDLSVDVGSVGVGLNVSMPVGDYVRLRAGFDVMPTFQHNMSFGVQVGDPSQQSESESRDKFERLATMLESLTGYRVDDHVDMVGEPTFNNFKLLVDVMPFRNKHWHFTAGFYWGSSRVAKARNTMEDMTSLMAMAIYNNMYEQIVYGDGLHFDLNGTDIPMFNDPEIGDRLEKYGRMGVHVGDRRADGTPYMMEPDGSNMVRAKIKVNPFRPYVGFGYGGRLLKGCDDYRISFDCGMMMWGGTPKILTHDGTDLARDVMNIRGKVGDYVRLIKGVKVYPVLQLQVSRRLF